MARNVEIKARVANPDDLRSRVASIADSGPIEFNQRDVFFHSAAGRLKLRTFGDGGGELIAYDRPDQTSPGPSEYFRTDCPDPPQLERVLARSLGIRGFVLKSRSVYLAGRTRIHLDRVEGLGDFLELEVVLAPSDILEVGQREANDLLDRLNISRDDLVELAYMDLLEAVAAN